MENLETLMEELREVKDGVNSALRDRIGDYKDWESAQHKKDLRKDITIWLLIIALVGSFFYYQWSFRKFIEQYDFETITIDATQDGNGVNQVGGGDVINGADSKNSNAPNETQGR